MKIPESLKIMGRTFKIEYDKTLSRERDSSGLICIDEGKIKILPDREEHRRCKDALIETLLHEIIHVAMYSLSYKELFNDENFVERLAHILHEIIPQIEGD